tara:strand:+ start:720 stop:1268 length:549 start_codon:yes stop_codon:yes gene_type:complete
MRKVRGGSAMNAYGYAYPGQDKKQMDPFDVDPHLFNTVGDEEEILNAIEKGKLSPKEYSKEELAGIYERAKRKAVNFTTPTQKKRKPYTADLGTGEKVAPEPVVMGDTDELLSKSGEDIRKDYRIIQKEDIGEESNGMIFLVRDEKDEVEKLYVMKKEKGEANIIATIDNEGNVMRTDKREL